MRGFVLVWCWWVWEGVRSGRCAVQMPRPAALGEGGGQGSNTMMCRQTGEEQRNKEGWASVLPPGKARAGRPEGQGLHARKQAGKNCSRGRAAGAWANLRQHMWRSQPQRTDAEL